MIKIYKHVVVINKLTEVHAHVIIQILLLLQNHVLVKLELLITVVLIGNIDMEILVATVILVIHQMCIVAHIVGIRLVLILEQRAFIMITPSVIIVMVLRVGRIRIIGMK